MELKYVEEEYALTIYAGDEFDPDTTVSFMMPLYDPLTQKILDSGLDSLSEEEKQYLFAELKKVTRE